MLSVYFCVLNKFIFNIWFVLRPISPAGSWMRDYIPVKCSKINSEFMSAINQRLVELNKTRRLRRVFKKKISCLINTCVSIKIVFDNHIFRINEN